MKSWLFIWFLVIFNNVAYGSFDYKKILMPAGTFFLSVAAGASVAAHQHNKLVPKLAPDAKKREHGLLTGCSRKECSGESSNCGRWKSEIAGGRIALADIQRRKSHAAIYAYWYYEQTNRLPFSGYPTPETLSDRKSFETFFREKTEQDFVPIEKEIMKTANNAASYQYKIPSTFFVLGCASLGMHYYFVKKAT